MTMGIGIIIYIVGVFLMGLFATAAVTSAGRNPWILKELSVTIGVSILWPIAGIYMIYAAGVIKGGKMK